MTIVTINERISKHGLKLVVQRVYSYDTDSHKYDAYIEYYNSKREKWGILHILGKYGSEAAALDAAKNYLRINNYLS